jgi:hypothetical protein
MKFIQKINIIRYKLCYSKNFTKKHVKYFYNKQVFPFDNIYKSILSIIILKY